MNGTVTLSIYFKPRNQFPPICGEPFAGEYIYRNITDDKILNSSIAEDEVRQSIKSLKNNKSPGPDDILNEMISKATMFLRLFYLEVFKVFLNGDLFLMKE